jgi:hypothetical protein
MSHESPARPAAPERTIMSHPPYRFQINEPVPLEEAELTLQLSIFAVEGIYGRAGVRLDARYDIDETGRSLTVDASTEVGMALVRVFAALLLREFGDNAFTICRGNSDLGASAGATAPEAQTVEAA